MGSEDSNRIRFRGATILPAVGASHCNPTDRDVSSPVAQLPTLPSAWACDLTTEALTWSGGVFDLFGIGRGDAIDRRSTLQFYLPESRKLLDRLRATALATCGSFTFEAQIRRVDGDLRWIRVSADVHKKDGRATTLYGMKQDITAEMASYRASIRQRSGDLAPADLG